MGLKRRFDEAIVEQTLKGCHHVSPV